MTAARPVPLTAGGHQLLRGRSPDLDPARALTQGAMTVATVKAVMPDRPAGPPRR
ncbi:MAG: hypothetical protein K0R62_4424, partial [Nonomuraea muscovyensis]|nr:hypothetical protein [Nonomuraea muscovyensis]